MRKAKQIICPAPMPENPVDARLAGLLVPAPHVVPEKKAKKEATGTRKSSRFQVSDDSKADSSPEDKEKKKRASPPAGEGKTRRASPMREAEGSKKGRTLSPGLLCQRRGRRRGLAFKGQAPGKIVNIRTPE